VPVAARRRLRRRPPPCCGPVDEETFESPQTGAVLETAFVYRAEGTTGTDLYLSITGSNTPPPDPCHRYPADDRPLAVPRS